VDDYRIAYGTHPVTEFMKLAESTLDEFRFLHTKLRPPSSPQASRF
jgi:hypothetical protein